MNGSACCWISPSAVEKSSTAYLCCRLRLIEKPALVIHLSVSGRHLDRAIEVVERVERATLGAIHLSASEVRERVVLVERERLVVVGERQVLLAHLAMHLAAVGVSLRVVGIDRDRAIEIGERFRVAPGAAEHAAAHVVGLRVVRIALHDFGERRDIGRRRRLRLGVLGRGAAATATAEVERRAARRERGRAQQQRRARRDLYARRHPVHRPEH